MMQETPIVEVINDDVQTIPTTATVVSRRAFNNKRVVLVLTNTSLAGETISIAIGREAKLGQGIVLQPNDSYTESMDAGYKPSTQEITAIASVATATLAIHEVLRD